MNEDTFDKIMESRFRVHNCPSCGALVFLEDEWCPQCDFDLEYWRLNWYRNLRSLLSRDQEM